MTRHRRMGRVRARHPDTDFFADKKIFEDDDGAMMWDCTPKIGSREAPRISAELSDERGHRRTNADQCRHDP